MGRPEPCGRCNGRGAEQERCTHRLDVDLECGLPMPCELHGGRERNCPDCAGSGQLEQCSCGNYMALGDSCCGSCEDTADDRR